MSTYWHPIAILSEPTSFACTTPNIVYFNIIYILSLSLFLWCRGIPYWDRHPLGKKRAEIGRTFWFIWLMIDSSCIHHHHHHHHPHNQTHWTVMEPKHRSTWLIGVQSVIVIYVYITHTHTQSVECKLEAMPSIDPSLYIDASMNLKKFIKLNHYYYHYGSLPFILFKNLFNHNKWYRIITMQLD